ncbi:diguanylate cyclase [Geotalea sp. SG265]|uniref:diguanylate cyclase n=1 Tax=Geotalea sp. SG265 TaxID=2922867 RepID=UPI001FB033A8|nr:diguanylate cyclase [Geotalea sp. SG265]
MPALLWPKPFRYFSNVRFFLLSLCVILSLFVVVVAYFLYARTGNLLLQRVREQALAYADLIDHTKMWNYDYGGVYVEKKRGVESNGYLLKIGVNPDLKTTDGRTLTLRNHAIMIKEISVRSEQQDGPSFRIVSSHPLDPANTPDPVEMAALGMFSQGAHEMSRLVLDNPTGPIYRFLLPLHADKSCLECHATRIGDVLGALSITLTISELARETHFSQLLIIVAAVVIIGLVVGITYFLTWRLVIKLDEAQWRLKRLASTDELTGLNNRRHILARLEEEFERSIRLDQPLCVIMLDLDFFKKINDTWGHPFGDHVLKWVANRMNEVVRAYDIIGRIGGEEFVIISPGTTLDEALVLAERLRETIEQETIEHGEISITLTVSAGIVLMDKGDITSDDLIRRADAALYRAKQAGRNRVAI